jgi:hypothetical protein
MPIRGGFTMDDVIESLAKWQMDPGKVRENVYRSATPRERERWHALRIKVPHNR